VSVLVIVLACWIAAAIVFTIGWAAIGWDRDE